MTTEQFKTIAARTWAKMDGLAAVLLLLMAGGVAGYFAGQSHDSLVIASMEANQSAEIQRLQMSFADKLEAKDKSARALIGTVSQVTQQASQASNTAAKAADVAQQAASVANQAAQAVKADSTSDKKSKP